MSTSTQKEETQKPTSPAEEDTDQEGESLIENNDIFSEEGKKTKMMPLEFLHTIKMIKDAKLRERLEKQAKTFAEKLNKRKDQQLKKLKNKLKDKIDRIKQRNEDPKNLVKRDEITYSIIMCSFVVMTTLLFYPNVQVTFAYISLKTTALLSWRIYSYRQKGWHYYMFDYCYLISVLMILCTLVFKDYNFYLLTTYFVSCGPLAMSFIFFKYRIVWHDIDTYSSFFMHLCPNITAWILRFHCKDRSRLNGIPSVSQWDEWIASLDSFGKFKIFLYGVAFYFAWAVIYSLLIFILLEERIERKNRQTLYSYALEHSGFMKFAVKTFRTKGKKRTNQLIYLGYHALNSILAIGVFSLIIFSKWITFGLMYAMLMKSVYTASTYYHEYFVKKYEGKINARAEANKQRRMRRQSSDSSD